MNRSIRRAARWVVLFGAVTALGDVPLVRDGVSSYEIVTGSQPSGVVRLAAKELQHFIERSSGVSLPTVAQPTAGAGHIFLGPAACDGVLDLRDLPAEGYRMKTVAEDLYIAGADTQGNPATIRSAVGQQCGTLNGVYEVLERHVGVVFAWHDELGTVVPERSAIIIPALDVEDAPDWSYRVLSYSPEGETGKLFGRRLRLGHALSVHHAHAWFSILPVAEYAAIHPEYYAQAGGRRVLQHYLGHHGGQVCTSNPEVAKQFAARALDYFERLPHRDMFSVSPNDGGGFCECARCQALDIAPAPEGAAPMLTDRLITFYNRIAERVADAQPGKTLGAYIYGPYKAPPLNAKPHPALTLVHATNSALRHGAGWEEEQLWEQRWAALTRSLFKYDIYYLARCSLNLIAPVTTHLIEKLRAEHANGVRGGYLYIGQSYEQLGAGHYLLAKLMWDKDSDARVLERRYYDALYGEAGPDVLDYYHGLEERLRTVFLGGVDVDEPAVAGLMSYAPCGASPALVLAAYWPILEDAAGLLSRAQTRRLTDLEQLRLERLSLQHELLVATVRGMIAAGRLEGQGTPNESDAAMLRDAVEQRERAIARIRQFAPTLAEYIDKTDLRESAPVSRNGAMHKLATARRRPEFTVTRCTDPPRLDGSGQDAAWEQAVTHYLLLNGSASFAGLGALVKGVVDDKFLYVLIDGRESAPDQLMATARGHDNAALFNEDNVELFIEDGSGTGYYHIGIGCGGATYDSYHPTGDPKEHDLAWSSGAAIAVRTSGTGWTAEIALPLDAVGLAPTSDKGRLVNVYRTRRGGVEPDEYTALAPTFGSYHQPAKFAQLRFEPTSALPAFRFGTFEEVKEAGLDQALRVPAAAQGSVQLCRDNVYVGDQAVRIAVEEGGLGALTLSAKVEAERAYRVSFPFMAHVRGRDPRVRTEAPIARVICRTEGGKAATPTSDYVWFGAPFNETETGWRALSHVFATPSGTTSISLTLFFHHPGVYWVDDVRLEAW